MSVAIADTGPLRYLVVTGVIELLPQLFTTLLVPAAVRSELMAPGAPEVVRAWASELPSWLRLLEAPTEPSVGLEKLGAGERDVITLALTLRPDVVLMDDRAGKAAARANGLSVIGTIGLLDRAAARRLIDIEVAAERLRETNFRYPQAVLDEVVQYHVRNRRQSSGTNE